MTSDQARTRIQSVLAASVAAATAATQQRANESSKRLLSDTDLEKKKEQAASRVQNIVGSAAFDFLKNTKNVKEGQKIEGDTADTLIDAAKNAIVKPDPSGTLSPNYLKAIRDSYQPDKSILARAGSNAPEYLAYLAKQIALNVEPYPYLG